MKVIIAGGRDHSLTPCEITELEMQAGSIPITEVVSGCSRKDAANAAKRGVDAEGARWARRKSIPVEYFPAKWGGLGRAAGPLRNLQMAEYADALIAIRGGVGTTNMVKTATRLGLRPIIEINR